MALKPWEVIDWSLEHQQTIYRDWGINYSFKQQFDKASKYYTKSLDIKNDDIKALLNRSLCKNDTAQCESALNNAVAALALNDLNHPVNLQVCDATYHLNLFEQTKIELSNKSRKFKWHVTNYHGVKVSPEKFTGHRMKPFLERLDIVEQNFLDNLGENVGIFLIKHSKKLDKIVEEIKKRKARDPRPMWKVLKEQNKCDIVSILLEEAKKLHIREEARLDQYYRVFLQVYFLKAWIDVTFLKSLITDKRLLLPQTKRSTLYLAEVAKSQYETVFKFLKMLQARSPLYTKRYKMCPNQKLAAKIRENHLYRVQYQTRRDMFNILDNVKTMRKKGDVDKLVEYIENAMGKYVETKTLRVMPRKFEFTNEIYNVLALTYVEKLKVPSNLMESLPEDRLFVLMNLPKDKEKEADVPFVFGDKSTYQEPDAPDYVYIAYKKRTSTLENRIPYAKYAIEKCYLFHEVARNHLTQSKFDEARALGKKVIDEAQLCNNYIWKFLGALTICKSNIIQRKLERVKESLEVARDAGRKLNCPCINYFMDTCTEMIQICINIKQSLSEEMLFSRKEKPRPSIMDVDINNMSTDSDSDD